MPRIASTRVAAGCAFALLSAGSAAAQMAGVYSGTSADGNTVSFTVSTDASGALAVTSALIFYSAQCNFGGPVLNEGEGFGFDAPISGGRASTVFSTPGFYTNLTFAFYPNGQSATGTVTTVAPDLEPYTNRPTKSYTCTSPRQDMMLTYQSTTAPGAQASDAAAKAPARTYVYDRPERIIGTTAH